MHHEERPGDETAERLREIIEESGTSLYRLGRDLDLAEGSLRRFLSGEGVPQFHTCALLADYFGYDLVLKRQRRKRG